MKPRLVIVIEGASGSSMKHGARLIDIAKSCAGESTCVWVHIEHTLWSPKCTRALKKAFLNHPPDSVSGVVVICKSQGADRWFSFWWKRPHLLLQYGKSFVVSIDPHHWLITERYREVAESITNVVNFYQNKNVITGSAVSGAENINLSGQCDHWSIVRNALVKRAILEALND